VSAELEGFVRESLSRGMARPAIGEALRAGGWRPDEIEAALSAYADLDFPVPVPRRRPYLSAREAFLYLVLFATLYTTAFNVGVVLFKWIEWLLQDPSLRWESARDVAQAARGATAGLIIAFPIFLFLSRAIGRTLERDPDKRGSRIRKWLTYLTLFVAALVERQRLLDAQRVEDLRRIFNLINTWTFRYRRPPGSLEELMADPDASGVRFHDPVTRNVYEYRMLDSLAYELCATFALADSATLEAESAGRPYFWKHPGGRTCYRLRLPDPVAAQQGRPLHGYQAEPLPPLRGGL
jgi:hypothetical protein